jgi:hypothetical protein
MKTKTESNLSINPKLSKTSQGNLMRLVIEAQQKIGQMDISEIEIDLKSRDEIPKTLLGLQQIYSNEPLRKNIFNILLELAPEAPNKKGRKGMTYWNILVLGVLRLSCNWDFDKLKDIADNHQTLRLMLQLSPAIDWKHKFGLQTIRDNISLFTPEILNKINHAVGTFHFLSIVVDSFKV